MALKKLRDIRTDIVQDIDIRNPERITSPHSNDSGEVFDEISVGKKSDIILKKIQSIIVSKRKGKNFDALEKKGNVSRFFLQKTLRVHSKKQITYLGMLRSFFSKGSKKFWKLDKSFIIGGFIVFCLVAGWSGKLLIENRVNAGYQKIINIKEGNLSFSEIQKKVNNARFDLLLADMLFSPFKIFPGEKINSTGYVISGGRMLSRGFDSSLELGGKIKNFIGQKEISKIYFSQLFLNSYPELQEIEASLRSSVEYYNKISWLPNDELLEKKNTAVQTLESFLSYIELINSHFPEFVNILGHDERKRYLIVFQNADEIRPTGGFMGSMGFLELFRGRVQLFQKKDVYAIEWDLKKSDYERLPAPKGIDALTDTFGLRDANYYANLKDSSNAIKFFTDRAGIDLDGIVYINQNILLRLLETTGPIYFEPLEREITSDNFSELMSLAVEAKSFKVGTLGTPKQVLFDFMEVFAEKLQEDAEYFEYLQSIVHDVESRDIMMWSFNEEENEFLSELGVNGNIDYDASLDYIYPVYTSLSGNKSDRYIEREYDSTVSLIEGSCDFDVEHTIKTTHNMTSNVRERIQSFISEYELDSPNLFEIQGASDNKQFVRIILPKNAKVTEKEGTEIVQYGSRQGIEFFIDTQLQETSFYTFSYILENPGCLNYNTTYYKQPGIPSFSTSMSIQGDNYNYMNLQEDFFFEYRR